MRKIINLWKNNQADNNMAVMCLATMIAVVTAYFLVLQPIRAKSHAVLRDIAVLREQTESLRSYDVSEQEFLASSKQLQQRYEQALQILPNSSDSFVTVTTVTDIAKNNNLSVRSFKVADISSKNGYKTERFDCVLSGGYFELVAFLEAIQKRRPMTNVQMIAINTESDDRLLATMQIYTYLLE